MADRNLILVGFMGSGKTLTSNKLSETLKRRVVSTDALIEQEEGRPISDIFRDSGEEYFRKVEKRVVIKVSQQTGIIIDCGGGVVLDPDNMTNLKKSGLVIYLSATPECIYNNIKMRKHRPLLDVQNPQEKIAELLKSRESYYQQADVTVDANRPIDQIAQDVLKVFQNE